MIENNPLLDRHQYCEMDADGMKSKIIKAGRQQFIFMEYDKDVEFPLHTHDSSEWGICTDGEMELATNGTVQCIRKGDHFLIEANQPHSAKVKAGFKGMVLVDGDERFFFHGTPHTLSKK